MEKEVVEIKCFNMRMPKHLWIFLKHLSATKGISMTDIIIERVDKYKKRLESRLTNTDTKV